MDATKTHLQSWQGCQPPEYYKYMSLNKPVTAMMNQHTWKCITKSDIVWQNWNQNGVVEGAKGINTSA